MWKYVFKRIMISIPVLLGITFLIFFLLNVVPGDPVALLMKEKASADVIVRVRAQMHLDDPWLIRYFRFLWGVLHGDFGISYKLQRPVTGLILHAFPKTLILALSAAVFSGLVGIPAGGH
jgi:peptide/nickel transport system permease protein